MNRSIVKFKNWTFRQIMFTWYCLFRPKSLYQIWWVSWKVGQRSVFSGTIRTSRQNLIGRGCFYCPKKVSSLEKVRDNRKLLIPLFCSEIISKWPPEKTENDFEVGIRSENFRQTENGAFLDGNRRPDVEIRFRTGFPLCACVWANA